MPDCVFCKLVSGEFPSYKLAETAHSFAFLDINTLSQGHCLVIPKKHHSQIYEVSKDELQDLAAVLHSLCGKIRQTFNPAGLNILQNNGRIAHQLVEHVHFHLIPKYETGQGLGIEWPAKQGAKEELQAVQGKLKLA